MTNRDFLAKEIFSRYGTVQRARGCFLYTKKGVRLTDLYQEGGRAILGWGNGSSSTVFKNTLNRHITGFFNTEFEAQTKKAVETLFCSPRTIFFYNNYSSALSTALAISKSATFFYRPWNDATVDLSSQKAIIFVPPYPWGDIFILAANPADATESAKYGILDPGIKIPAPLHSAISRSVYDLISALKTREEKDFFIYDQILHSYWQRKGPYLFPKMDINDYQKFVLHCLDLSLVISPDYNMPSIIPFGADKGVFTKLKNTPFEFKPSTETEKETNDDKGDKNEKTD